MRIKRCSKSVWGCVACVFLLAGVFATGNPVFAVKEGVQAMNFEVSSTVFGNGAYIPKKYTGEGADVSPPLRWNNPPAAVKSFALICDDPDAPVGTWVHWVLFNLPPSLTDLPEALPKEGSLPNGARQGMNDFKRLGYGGPMPPRGSDHRYFFKLYALDAMLSLPAGANKADVVKAMAPHVLGQAELMGRYKR